MRANFPLRGAALISICSALIAFGAPAAPQPVKLFTQSGAPKGWLVRDWSDVGKEAPAGARWTVDDNGILHGSDPRGTWLISEKEYSDFELELEFKLPPRGNSGVALRAPLKGDPAYVGMELQIVDPRYYDGNGRADQLTGSIYRLHAPDKQVFKPEEWNRYQITCRGPHIKVVLNGVTIQDLDADRETAPGTNDKMEPTPPLRDRPRRGHIGFQELSRGGHVQMRNVTLRVLSPAEN